MTDARPPRRPAWRTAYRLAVFATLAVLAFNMARAAHLDSPWPLLIPAAILAALASRYGKKPE